MFIVNYVILRVCYSLCFDFFMTLKFVTVIMYIIYYRYIVIVVYVSVKIFSESSVILNKIVLKQEKRQLRPILSTFQASFYSSMILLHYL